MCVLVVLVVEKENGAHLEIALEKMNIMTRQIIIVLVLLLPLGAGMKLCSFEDIRVMLSL